MLVAPVMRIDLARPLRTILALAAMGLVTACGGGGGSVTRPTLPANSSPPPPPPPPETNFDTLEYRSSTPASFIDAITAYEAGATGKGVKIAVIDSGVDLDSAEFAGRIDPASRDVAGSRGIDDEDGHGTAVSAVALAARNGTDIQGVAFDSTLIALRTDEPGTCASEDGCLHYDDDLSVAVDVAVAAGARVINMSLGGSGPSPELQVAIANATASGVIIVISAGNDSSPDPDPFAQVANEASVARGRVLIAGATSREGAISSFSNRAGNSAEFFLATVGEDVVFDHVGTPGWFSGTSFAAPGVAGAVALLASAFPNLTADEIVDILMNSAIDAGAAGIDPVYGRGLLNLRAAFSPMGATSLPGGSTEVASDAGSVAVMGGALGDGGKLGGSLGDVVILDGYGRAFSVDLGRRVTRAAPRPALGAALALSGREVGERFGTGGYSVSIALAASTRPWVDQTHRGLDAHAGEDGRVTRGFVSSRLGKHFEFGMAAGYGADDLLARMGGGRRGGAFIASGDALRDDGMAVLGTVSAAARYPIGEWTLGVAAGNGEAAALRPDLRRDRPDVAQLAATLSRHFGPLGLNLAYNRLDESGTILGAEGSAALGLRRAVSDFLGLDASYALGGGWSLGATARAGRTDLDIAPGGLTESAGDLASFAFALDVAKNGLFAANDRLALRISQPLRVERGALALHVPISYDYRTLRAGYERRAISIAPSGREIDVEAAWSLRLPLGTIDANLYWRQDPGHIAALGDDLGAALRLSTAF